MHYILFMSCKCIRVHIIHISPYKIFSVASKRTIYSFITFIPFYFKTRELLRFPLAEVSAPNGSFIKIKFEPLQLSRVSERFFLSRWVIRQYSGLDISCLSCRFVPELRTSPSLFIVRYWELIHDHVTFIVILANALYF